MKKIMVRQWRFRIKDLTSYEIPFLFSSIQAYTTDKNAVIQ